MRNAVVVVVLLLVGGDGDVDGAAAAATVAGGVWCWWWLQWCRRCCCVLHHICACSESGRRERERESAVCMQAHARVVCCVIGQPHDLSPMISLSGHSAASDADAMAMMCVLQRLRAEQSLWMNAMHITLENSWT